MDDLCDPDFYLTYTSQATMPITSNAMESGKINGDLNRKSKNESEDQSTNQNYFTNSTTAATVAAAATAKLNEPNLKSIKVPGKNTLHQ